MYAAALPRPRAKEGLLPSVIDSAVYVVARFIRWLLSEPWWTPENAPLLAIPAGALLAGAALCRRFGPLPPRRSRASQPHPPDALSPAELSVLLGRGGYTRRVASTLVDLAVRGELALLELAAQSWWRSTDYLLLLRPAPSRELAPHERPWLDGSSREARLSACNGWSSGKRSKFLHALRHRGYFRTRADRVRGYWLLGVCSLGSVALSLVRLTPPRLAAVLLGVVILGAWVWRVNSRTPLGTGALERALAFERFLRELDFTDCRSSAVARRSFERFLPYAIALGLEADWARRIGRLRPRFAWCSDAAGTKKLEIAGFTRTLCRAIPVLAWREACLISLRAGNRTRRRS